MLRLATAAVEQSNDLAHPSSTDSITGAKETVCLYAGDHSAFYIQLAGFPKHAKHQTQQTCNVAVLFSTAGCMALHILCGGPLPRGYTPGMVDGLGRGLQDCGCNSTEGRGCDVCGKRVNTNEALALQG